MICSRCPNQRDREGQRLCRECHAKDMKIRRANARANGTYTLRTSTDRPAAPPAGMFHVKQSRTKSEPFIKLQERNV